MLFLDFSQVLLIWKTLDYTIAMMAKELTLKDSFVLSLLINSVQESQLCTQNYGLNLIQHAVVLLMLNALKNASLKNNI